MYAFMCTCTPDFSFLLLFIVFISILLVWYFYVYKNAMQLHISVPCKFTLWLVQNQVPNRKTWAEAICFIMCLWVILMELKAGSFMVFAPILHALHICKYVIIQRHWQIQLRIMPLLCAFLFCWQEGGQRIREDSHSSSEWQEKRTCPLSCSLVRKPRGPLVFLCTDCQRAIMEISRW